MKKFFYSLLFMAMAIVSAVSFVSCGGDDDDMEIPAKEAYLLYVCWVSNDILELADVVTDGVNFSFNSTATYGDIAGKEGKVELSGKAATDAKFTISFKLKSNWKEILANKDVAVCAYVSGQGNAKGEEVIIGNNVITASFNKKSIGEEEFEKKVSGYISSIEFRSK